jgi:2',3'-cyclic-nucleotide 2'-phosphodiesterase / 3'-nucleotidase
MVFRAVGILLCAVFLQAQDTRLQILETTDVRGHVLPVDSFTLQPAPGGWARLGTLIRALRAANPNTLLVDCGDGTRGEPINYVWSLLKPGAPEPTMALMNALGYQAMVVGHHEFDLGFKTLRTVEEQAQFPWLAANIHFAGTDKHAFTPYLKVEVGGVSVAILGLVTGHARPRAPGRAAPDEGLSYQDPVVCAREMVPQLRDREKVDLVVVALHSGLGTAPCGQEEENQAHCLAEQVKGIDLILAGHTGQQVSTKRNGVPILQAGTSGQVLGVAEVVLHKGRSRWEVVSCETRLAQPAPEMEPDPAVLQATAELRALTETYLNTFATTLNTDLDGRWCRMEDTALAHLLHTVVRQATGAQLTAVAAPSSKIFVPRGTTSVRQFYALAPREDAVARIRVTGRQVRAYLEQAARYYAFSHLPDLYNRAAAPDAFDTLDGCAYALDISRPAGSRVVELSFQGHPMKDDQVFTLGLSTRRLAGAGGYLEAMGWHGDPEFVSAASLRNLLLAQVLAKPTLTVGTSDNWRIIPALDRERVLAQQP